MSEVFVAAQCEWSSQADVVLEHVKNYVQNTLKSQNKIVVISSVQTSHQTFVLGEFLIHLYRKYGIEANEREMVLSHEDRLLAVQFCLAEYNKKHYGDFDIEASRVLDYSKRLLNEKLDSETSALSDKDYSQVKDMYNAYLQQCNVTDLAGVYYQLKEATEKNDALNGDLKQTHFLMIGRPSGMLEKCITSLLFNGKPVKCVELACPLDQSLSANSNVDNLQVTIEDSTWELIESEGEVVSANSKRSITELIVLRLMLNYVHLLINTRSELALATVINTPERGLSHAAFTDIRHEAKLRKMPMYQVIMSFIMRLRIGGRSFRLSDHAVLAPHVKGLSEFIDLMQKLQNIVEENADTRVAAKKVVNVLKNIVLKCQECGLRRESVVAVTDKLLRQVDTLPSPTTTSISKSLVGRQALRVLQTLVDCYAGHSPSCPATTVLCDSISSQSTPLRFPSLLSQFRSPLEHSPEAPEAQSLSQRIQQKMSQSQPNSKPLVPRYGSCMDWAQPAHDTGIQPPSMLPVVEDIEPVCSVFVPTPPVDVSSVKPCAKRPLISCNDQENSSVQLDSNPPTKKRAVIKAAPKKKITQRRPANKKQISLQKGQKQLTAFFRI